MWITEKELTPEAFSKVLKISDTLPAGYRGDMDQVVLNHSPEKVEVLVFSTISESGFISTWALEVDRESLLPVPGAIWS